MTDMTNEQAITILQGVPEYDWVTRSEKAWWTVTEIAEQAGVSQHVVRGWCDNHLIHGATQYERQVGWRIPRAGLLVFFAERVRLKQSQQSAG